MVLRKVLTASIAASIALASTASVAAEGEGVAAREASNVEGSEQLGGTGTLGWIIALAVAAGVALVIIEDDDDEPVSP